MRKCLLIFVAVLIILASGCTYSNTPNYQYTPSDSSPRQNEALQYDDRGISIELKEMMSIPYLKSINKTDCSEPANYGKSQMGYGFYAVSKWIPSTGEGTFDSIVEAVTNTGCTNLFPRYIVYIIFGSEVIKKIDYGCYPDAEPLRPTEGYASGGALYFEGEKYVVNQTGQYIVQTDVIDCVTNDFLARKAVMVDMGNINEDYYNQVVASKPLNIEIPSTNS